MLLCYILVFNSYYFYMVTFVFILRNYRLQTADIEKRCFTYFVCERAVLMMDWLMWW